VPGSNEQASGPSKGDIRSSFVPQTNKAKSQFNVAARCWVSKTIVDSLMSPIGEVGEYHPIILLVRNFFHHYPSCYMRLLTKMQSEEICHDLSVQRALEIVSLNLYTGIKDPDL
jgi:hypothetical protein